MGYLKEILRSKEIIMRLAINDFKVKYIGSYLGVFWGFIQPLITILIYWFVFEVGFRSGTRPDGTPFIVWLIVGIVPWFFISEAMVTTTNSLWEYSYLVKKISFNVIALPIVKILSALIMHLIFVVIVTVVITFFGYFPTIDYLAIIYYIFCSMYFLLGFGLLSSSLAVFTKDVSQFVSIAVQIGFWMIPIVWSEEVISASYRGLFEWNPAYYIVSGYRKVFLGGNIGNGFQMDIRFWLVSTVLLMVGLYAFRKLRAHFADVI